MHRTPLSSERPSRNFTGRCEQAGWEPRFRPIVGPPIAAEGRDSRVRPPLQHRAVRLIDLQTRTSSSGGLFANTNLIMGALITQQDRTS